MGKMFERVNYLIIVALVKLFFSIICYKYLGNEKFYLK